MLEKKISKKLEKHTKGVSNHYRIRILFLIARHGAITLNEIVEMLQANEKTIGEHTRRLSLSGLVNKKYKGKFVYHTLSPYGRIFYKFLESFIKHI